MLDFSLMYVVGDNPKGDNVTTIDVERNGGSGSHESRELLRSLLLCELAEQSAQASSCRGHADRLAGAQDGESLLEREMAEVAAMRADVAVVEARHALAKLHAGTYGCCERCGQEIPFDRLDAIPQARFCVSCAAATG